MDPLTMAGLGIGGLGAIGGIINTFTSGGKLQALMRNDPTYKANPLAAQRTSLAQNLLNARMPGATSMERNIYGNQANQLANVNRNATDSSQALALGSAAQGQTNQAFQNLSTQEQQDYYNRLQNLNGAQQGQIAEGDKVYQDQVRRFQDQSAITGAQMQNQAGAYNSLSNLGFGGAQLSSFLNMMGKKNNGGQGSAGSYLGMQPQNASAYQQNNMSTGPTFGGVINPFATTSAWAPQI